MAEIDLRAQTWFAVRRQLGRACWAARYTVLFFLFLSALTACRLDQAPQAEDRVRFMVFGDPAELAAYRELVNAFKAERPEIEVELVHVPSQEDYRIRLVTEYAAGSPPDVSLLNYRRYAAFAAEGLLEPIGPYLAESETLSVADYYPLPMEAFTWKGELTCLPQNVSSLVVYFNVDLFAAAGLLAPADVWSWEQFLEAAKALTLDRDGDGRNDQYGLGLEPTLVRLAPFIWQNGGELVNDRQNPERLMLARPAAMAALQWFVDLRQVHGVTPDREEEASLDSESRFLAGTLAMYLNSRRGTPAYRAITGFRWDVAQLPRGERSAGILHSDGYCLARASQNKEAAWALIEFANSAAGQTIVARSGRIVPSLIAVAESPVFLDPDLPPFRSQVFLSTLPDLRLLPLISTWEEIEAAAGEEIARAYYGDIRAEEAAALAVERTLEYFFLRRLNAAP